MKPKLGGPKFDRTATFERIIHYYDGLGTRVRHLTEYLISGIGQMSPFGQLS